MTLWDGSFPFYPGTNACFPFDTTWAIIASVFLSALVTCIIILPGIRGKGRLFWLLRVVTSLFIGAVILTMQFTRDWESGWVTANTSYKSFSLTMVNADIGLHIGLAGVNITLVGNPVNQVNETINYNEHFAWSFDADYDHSYSEGLEKGLPSPILYVAEKFTTHSPCNVHRQYRISSCYASIMLCEEHPKVSHPVWVSLPENRLRQIFLADIHNRAALPAAGAGCDCSQLCAPAETEACLQPGGGNERRSRWVGQVPPASRVQLL
ncbi:dual oxidase maturation factor 1 isoform X2 [Excalfactoria chinensis]|uniref:dual oxidase maturation factor 1 isoform X2 n=1 Tax=Excalfactoria chinensis TaxID=46218 RepID=UPI003B3B9055